MIFVVKVYQWLSPALHFLSQIFGLPCQCKFVPSCSEYAIQEFSNKNQSDWKALLKVFRRIALCSPFSR